VPEGHSPTARRRELGAVLRALRLEKGLTADQVAQHLMCSVTKVSRMETGQRAATLRDVRDLCDLYGIADEAERERMMTLAREARQQAWWQAYDLPYETYVGLEAEAVTIKCFQSSVVPGLLQTAGYAHAGHEGALPRLSDDEIERRTEARLKRQLLLTRPDPDPPALTAVLDEAVLHRAVGGARVMAAQLEYLAESADLPSVTIQVIPFSVGAHPGVESNFNIVELPGETPDIVFAEGLVGSIYLQRDEDLARYQTIFARLQEVALSPESTVDLIAKFLRDYQKE
jgi:transcriptional regulator with XRE-family HTH domain